MSRDNKNSGRDLWLSLGEIRGRVLASMPGSVDEALGVVDGLRNKAWGYDQPTEALQRALFDPARRGWDSISFAALSLRVPVLPDAFIPQSEAGLTDLLQRLMSWERASDLVGELEMGWPRSRFESSDDIARFLWSLRDDAPKFFHATVTGRLAQAIAVAIGPEATESPDFETLVDLIGPLALIWSAFDAQRVAAMARYVSTRPFEMLLTGTMTSVKAATHFVAMRAAFLALRGVAFTEYRTKQQRDEERRPGMKPKPSGSLLVRRMAKTLKLSKREAVQLRRQLDSFFTDLRARRSMIQDPLWKRGTYKKPTRVFGSAPLSTIWFAKLHPVQMIAVTVIRLVDAERQAQSVVERMVMAHAQGSPASDVVLQPVGNPVRKSDAGRERQLIHYLRGAILRDSLLESRRNANPLKGDDLVDYTKEGAPAGYETFRKVARAFIARAVGAGAGSREQAVSRQLDISFIERLTRNARI